MSAPLTGELREQLAPETGSLRIDQIIVGERKRALAHERVQEIAESIQHEGILQPIGVRRPRKTSLGHAVTDEGFVLIYGWHRLEAFRQLYRMAEQAVADPNTPTAAERSEVGRWEYIPCNIYPANMPDEWAEAYERLENLRRAELTREQRQKLGGEHGAWLERLRRERDEAQKSAEFSPGGTEPEFSSTGTGQEGRPQGWFRQWYESVNIPKNTALNWWRAFLADTQRPRIPPGQADEALRAAFWAYLQAREDERKAKDQQAYEETQARLQRERLQQLHGNAVAALQQLRQEAGDDAVLNAFYEVMPHYRPGTAA